MEPNQASDRLTANEWRIVLVTSVGHALCHVAEMICLGAIYYIMLDLRLTSEWATAITMPGFLLFGIGAVPAGILTDRFGSKFLLQLYFFLLAIASVLVARSDSALTLGITLTLLGAAISIYHPAGLAMISLGCRHRGKAMGINGVAGSLGVAGGPAIGIYVAQSYHWRMAYWLLAGLAVAACLLSVLLKVELEGSKSSPTVGIAQKRFPIAIAALLFAAMLVGGFNYRSAMTAMPTFLSNPDAPAEPDEAAELTGASSIDSRKARVVFFVLAIGGIGQLLGGYLADRFPPALVYGICILTTGPLALLVGWSAGAGVIFFASLFAVVMFAEQPLENTMVADITPPNWRSTVYGVKFILTFGVGSVGALAAGWAWQEFGLASVFTLFAIVTVPMALLALTFWRQRAGAVA